LIYRSTKQQYGNIIGNSGNVAVAAGLLNCRSRGPILVEVPCETEVLRKFMGPV